MHPLLRTPRCSEGLSSHPILHLLYRATVHEIEGYVVQGSLHEKIENPIHRTNQFEEAGNGNLHSLV
ncbi:hypothetical protein PM082_000251 [Marasmius tenuissimus]|nr:hypothetical protein PM082_000251 [Marasmius tenuissimus]